MRAVPLDVAVNILLERRGRVGGAQGGEVSTFGFNPGSRIVSCPLSVSVHPSLRFMPALIGGLRLGGTRAREVHPEYIKFSAGGSKGKFRKEADTGGDCVDGAENELMRINHPSIIS